MNLDQLQEEESLDSLKLRPKRKELNTPKDYREQMAKVTKRPIKLICILTAHWQDSWFRDMHGDLKWQKDRSKHAMIVNSWIKKCKLNKLI